MSRKNGAFSSFADKVGALIGQSTAMSASFQTLDGGMSHQDEMPQVTPPEELPSVPELLAGVKDGPAKKWVERRAIDIRHVEGTLYLEPAQERTTRQNVWIRATGDLPRLLRGEAL